MIRALTLIALILVAPGTRAETWPARPVRIVVPWAAGGVADIAARMLAEAMREPLGQPAIVDNRPGASGKIGTELVARAAADGYTLLLGSPSGLTLPTVVDRAVTFDPVKDFRPVVQISSSTYFLVVDPALPVRSLADLIAHARAHPGKLNYGSWGAGTATHLAGAMLAEAAKIDIVHVPYKGEAPVVQDIMAGALHMAFVIDARTPVEAGRVRALGTTSPEPWFTLPTVPPIGESALPGFKFLAWQALLVPAGTPDAVVATLAAAANTALASERMQAILRQNGFRPVGGDGAVLARTMAEDLAAMRKLVADTGLRFDN